MNKKSIIRKIIVLVAWILVISGISTLLVAANRKEKSQLCSEVIIRLKGSGEKFYIEKDDILMMIERTARGPLIGKSVAAMPVSRMEKVLENSPWIRDAELYFDKKNTLHVWVEERQPVARVFTTGGYSFYIDSSGHKLPLLEKFSARLPVVTGFTHGGEWKKRDSILMNEVKLVATYVYEHPFWNAQVGQIDITPQGQFELIPVVGDHIIRLGSGEDIHEKLDRLYIFYKQVLSKTGFNKYGVLDIQYAGQVVAVKKGVMAAVDSAQLQKNIEELMNRNSLQQVEESMLPATMAPVPVKDSIRAATSVRGDMEQNGSVQSNDSSSAKSRPVKKKMEVKPKAVMERKEINDE